MTGPRRAALRATEFAFPSRAVGNEELAAEIKSWSAEQIESKTGIRRRFVVGPDECASDLAFAAARKLFESGACTPTEIDYLIFCTQSPDYFLPTSACLLQHRLALPKRCGALDINLGCSGFVYGLGLAKGLIETGQARNVLLLTADTYSKFIHPGDKSVRTLFGDAGAATLIGSVQSESERIGPFVYGTDGAGGENLIVPTGGMRKAFIENPPSSVDASGNFRTANNLYMNGPEIFNFTLRVVPEMFTDLLRVAGRKMEEIDLFVFHQANQYMLEHLRKKLGIPQDKFLVCMRDCGNTVSSTIPIALKHAVDDGKLRPGSLVMLVGFGVGYSWGATLLRWPVLGL